MGALPFLLRLQTRRRIDELSLLTSSTVASTVSDWSEFFIARHQFPTAQGIRERLLHMFRMSRLERQISCPGLCILSIKLTLKRNPPGQTHCTTRNATALFWTVS